MMTQKRLTEEAIALTTYFPKRFQFVNYGKSDSYLDVGVSSTTMNLVYRLKITLANFPINCPEVYITHPTYLKDKNGKPMQSTDHAQHTLGGYDGYTKLCHYSKNWNSKITLYYVILKAKVWIEAYEGHLLSGKSIDHFVKGNY